MNNLDKLSALFLGRDIKLTGNGRTPANGTTYTAKEVEIASFICRLALTVMTGQCKTSVSIEELEQHKVIVELFQAQAANFQTVAQGIRLTYRQYEAFMLAEDSTLADFPKVDDHGDRVGRDQSSLTVLFRKSIKDLVEDKVR